ncbi:Multi antimicrobial extrusion protein (Na(+)/drug antiporter) [Mucinivorans hirudinis]|uniref:Multidrug-efflux transporter n=1 Tax=Mucinivorans hirudinis TaxID=1433126 RepID=A0A060R9J6_9BACT|nr:Multi antimicrobial extrusion protein (Na(+)/drug antiporter) [Mucinivorans hirudinis]
MTDFTQGRIGRQIITFSIPIILGNFFMQFYQIVDSIIVGQVLGKEALAAVGAAFPVIFAVIALMIGIGSGASVVIAQYFGAKQTEKVITASDTIHIFFISVSIIIGILAYFFSEDVFRFIDLPEDILPLAVPYLQVYLGGIVFMFGFQTINAILRGVGDSKTPLYFLVLSSLLNVVLDIAFVLWFGWGIVGAAWATVLASAVAYFASIYYINRKDFFFRIDLFRLKFDKKIFGQSVRYGLPTGIQQSVVAYGMVALMSIVSGFGTDVVAGYSIGIRVENLAVIPAMNFALALQSFTGQNVGAGRWDRVREGLKKTLIFSSITCVIITTLIVLWGREILMMFTSDIQVINVGEEYLVIVSSFYLLFSSMFVINGMLRGAGAVIVPMFTTMISLWLVRIPLAVWFSREIGEVGIWWSVPAGWALGLILSYVYYKTGKWKKHSLFAKGDF